MGSFLGGIGNIASDLVSGVGSAVGGIPGAIGQATQQFLANAPSSSINSVLGGALNGLSGLNLTDPGQIGQMSGTGGVTPGDGLKGAMARSDPLLSFCWYIQLPVIMAGSTQQAANAAPTSMFSSLTNGLTAGLSQGLAGGFSTVSGMLSNVMGGVVPSMSAAQLPWYYVEEASLPFRSFSSKSIFREGRDRHYPDKYSLNGLTLTLYADSDNSAFTYIQAWNNNILTPFTSSSSQQLSGAWGRAIDYKLPIYVYLMDVTKTVIVVLQYVECWPTTLQTITLNSESHRVVHQVDFSVGDVYINLMSVSKGVMSNILSNTANNALTSVINYGAKSLSGSLSGLFNSTGSIVNSVASFF